jgi:hypothetical protein
MVKESCVRLCCAYSLLQPHRMPLGAFMSTIATEYSDLQRPRLHGCTAYHR